MYHYLIDTLVDTSRQEKKPVQNRIVQKPWTQRVELTIQHVFEGHFVNKGLYDKSEMETDTSALQPEQTVNVSCGGSRVKTDKMAESSPSVCRIHQLKKTAEAMNIQIYTFFLKTGKRCWCIYGALSRGRKKKPGHLKEFVCLPI